MNHSNSLKIIAEIGSIHDGSLGNAIKAIDVISESGADIVKFQTHIAEAESLSNAPSPDYFKDESRNEYFERTSFTFDQWIKISEHCSSKGVEFISSPFSIEAVELLEKIGVKAYKVPSGLSQGAYCIATKVSKDSIDCLRQRSPVTGKYIPQDTRQPRKLTQYGSPWGIPSVNNL